MTPLCRFSVSYRISSVLLCGIAGINSVGIQSEGSEMSGSDKDVEEELLLRPALIEMGCPER